MSKSSSGEVDTAPRSAGRPSNESKKEKILEEYGVHCYRIMCAEYGKPVETLSQEEFDALAKNLRKERKANWMHLIRLGTKVQ